MEAQESTMRGRLTEEGAQRLYRPDLAGVIVDFVPPDADHLTAMAVYYQGTYVGGYVELSHRGIIPEGCEGF